MTVGGDIAGRGAAERRGHGWGARHARRHLSPILAFRALVMKLALVGTGQMGQAVDALAPARGHTVVARFHSARPLTDASGPEAFAGAAVAIDFSLPPLALPHLRRYARWRQPAVVGTTGWADARDEVAALVRQHEALVCYAPNFSLGVALLRHAVRAVAPLVDALEDVDPYVHEMHHRRKVDSPSGTARLLAETLLEGLSRKTRLEPEAQHDRIDAEALHVTSTRAGHVYGEHTVGFDGPFDRLTLAHAAKGREGFAFGAVRAAEWLAARADEGATGLFSLDDVLADWLG